jgi:hypothetical protein
VTLVSRRLVITTSKCLSTSSVVSESCAAASCAKYETRPFNFYRTRPEEKPLANPSPLVPSNHPASLRHRFAASLPIMNAR